jgi:hypothetical protein
MARSAFSRLTLLPKTKDAIMNSKFRTSIPGEVRGLSPWRSALSSSTAIARLASLAVLGMAATTAAQAQNLPTGGSVSSGSATVSSGPNGLTINQTSQNVALNWQSFSIGADKNVTFVQPNSKSVALNRVLGADPSVILGGLTANGKVFRDGSIHFLFHGEAVPLDHAPEARALGRGRYQGSHPRSERSALDIATDPWRCPSACHLETKSRGSVAFGSRTALNHVDLLVSPTLRCSA